MTPQSGAQIQAVECHTDNASQTLQLGRHLGAKLQPRSIVALNGDLGSGKTWFAKGVAQGLGVPDEEYVTSPAYDLIHEYHGRLPVFHIDFYRLDELSVHDRAWLEEYLFGNGVSIIEWADKFIDILADSYLSIELSMGKVLTQRTIRISATGGDYGELLREASRWRLP